MYVYAVAGREADPLPSSNCKRSTVLEATIRKLEMSSLPCFNFERDSCKLVKRWSRGSLSGSFLMPEAAATL